MRLTRRFLWALVPIAAILAAIPPLTWRPFAVAAATVPDGPRPLSGVVHVHTSLSDGRGTPEEVIDAAIAAGLDYLVITDHNNFEARRFAGYSGRLLIIVGTEVSTRQGHLLAFGFPEPTFRFSDDASEVLEDVDYLDGAAVIAHPDSPKEGFRWTQWDIPGAAGIEILNGDTEWRSLAVTDALRLLLAYPLNPTYALLHILNRPGATLEQWDRRLQQRNTPMVAGADAHGVPSYGSVFTVARNHLALDRPLSGNGEEDTAAVVAALKRGSGYVGIDGLAPARGFSFVAEHDGRRWTMGNRDPVTLPVRLRAGGSLPAGSTVSLFRDGRLVKQAQGQLDWPDAGAGVYRVEVRVPGWDVPWILSNPIYAFETGEFEARRQRERVSAPAVPPATMVLDDFNAATVFEPASDGSTRVETSIVVPHSGLDGSAAARLQFRLAMPSARIASPFAALVSQRDRDLSGRRGLVFSIKSDRVYRVWVQVRDENRQSSDGTEWWYASVRTSPEWSRVVVPFDRLRSRDDHTDGRLNLDKTKGVLFIVDTGVVPPGAEGVIWIDDVGVY